ncbi:MAG: hypothetical protein ACE14T_10305 [Syntrophales bacterium]
MHLRTGLFIFLSAVSFFIFMADTVPAFCVYNNTADSGVYFEQTGGGDVLKGKAAFYANLYPGGARCCHWRDRSCNKKGTNTAPVTFNITVYEREEKADIGRRVLRTFEKVALPADASIEVTGAAGGRGENFRINIFNE